MPDRSFKETMDTAEWTRKPMKVVHIDADNADRMESAASRGMANLAPQITALREELKPLEAAFTKLQGIRYKAQYYKAKVTHIPAGVSSKNKPRIQKELTPEEIISTLDAEGVKKMLAQLKDKLK